MAVSSFNLVLATILLICACLILPFSALAQTTHVVGGNMGWVIPLADAGAYTTWATSRTFTVGDKLVFNYAAGQHDVTQSSKAAYDACNASLPIISTTTAAPAAITLTTSGQKYFFCTVGRHCALGQKLAINVVSATVPSPAPALAPALPRKVGAPAPAPTAQSPASVTTAEAPEPSASTGAYASYTVGDSMGWSVPQGGEADYKTWAADKNFAVGDTLVFQFAAGRHDVAEVPKTSYGSCASSNSITKHSTGPARITLTSPGEHFYICTFNSHCSLGQKLAINVTDSKASSPAPTTTSAIPPSTPNLSSPSPEGTIPSTIPGSHASFTSFSGLYVVVFSISVAYMLH